MRTRTEELISYLDRLIELEANGVIFVTREIAEVIQELRKELGFEDKHLEVKVEEIHSDDFVQSLIQKLEQTEK